MPNPFLTLLNFIKKKNPQGFLLFLLSLLIFSCSSQKVPKKSPEEKKADIFYSYGTYYLINKDYTQALENLLKASNLGPKDSKIHNNLGMTYYFKEKKEKAIFHLKKSLELDPQNSDARNNLAGIYLENGQIEMAEKEYIIVKNNLIYKQQFRTLYNLGLISLKRGNKTKAKKLFAESIKENPSYCPPHFELGKLHMQEKNYQNAFNEYLESSKGTCYEEPAPHYFQALALLKLDDLKRAKQKFEEIIGRFQHTKYATLATIKLNAINKKINEYGHIMR